MVVQRQSLIKDRGSQSRPWLELCRPSTPSCPVSHDRNLNRLGSRRFQGWKAVSIESNGPFSVILYLLISSQGLPG